jgi:phosphoglycerol transferase MdoB-like AlkP superfamily enzyme
MGKSPADRGLDLGRLTTADKLIGLGGILFAISAFLDWFKVTVDYVYQDQGPWSGVGFPFATFFLITGLVLSTHAVGSSLGYIRINPVKNWPWSRVRKYAMAPMAIAIGLYEVQGISFETGFYVALAAGVFLGLGVLIENNFET